jgi:hypothetical protein
MVSQHVHSTSYFMADGSIIIDEPGQPLRKIESGAKATLHSHGPADWDPPVRDLTVVEAARWMSEQQRLRG